MQYKNVFWTESAFITEGQVHQPPSILAIGDSWFWYPFPGGSLLNQLGDLVAPKEHNILAVGKNGAEAYDYAFGIHATAVRRALRFHGDVLMGVFISGGGNDFAGFNDLRPLLLQDCSKAESPKACFDTPSRELERLLDNVEHSYLTLIGQVIAACEMEVRVYLHNYDYPNPNGKGIFSGSSWLKSAMEDAGVAPELRADCMKYVIDQFSERLKRITALNHKQVRFVDGRDCLQPQHWANELHPKPEGFKKLAEERWLPVLAADGMA